MNMQQEWPTESLEPATTASAEELVQTLLSSLQVAVLEADAHLRITAHAQTGSGPDGTGGGATGALLPPLLSRMSADVPETLAGRSLTELFPELVSCEQDLEAVALGRSSRFELPMINRLDSPLSGADADRRSDAGSRRWYLSLTALPHPSIQGHIILLVQDVTTQGRLSQQMMQQLNEVRLLRAQLEAANEKLVRLSEQKSAFMRVAAHDLRAPLAVIKGYVELVMEDAGTALDEESFDCLRVVIVRAQEMAHLIDDLLDVEKIESGSVALEKRPVDLGNLVEQVVKGFQPEAERRSQKLQWHIAAGLPKRMADRSRLVQVLDNLVSNALKFTPAGGMVRIEVLHRDGCLVVEVSDTGPGISNEDQARLFQRFFRTDSARLQRIPGTGLGLCIARAIVEQHGGQMTCHSRLGEGSTFGFTLPLEEA